MAGDLVDEYQALANARIGKTLRGKLRLDRLIGVGGTASVYAATHRTGKRYAVKVIHPQLMFDESTRQRFFREGYVVNRIEHPGVVAVVDDDVDDDGGLFLVMELLEGENVDALAARLGGRLPPGDVLYIVEQALDVLAAAHDRGIIHRDFKPENVFCTKSGAIKVLDFGIARLRELGRTAATRTGWSMGTPAFMPPEQARGRWSEVDARTDIWAVGATMFTLLTGRIVHEAQTMNEALLAAMSATAPPIRRILPTVPPEVEAIVDRALAPERIDRFPDARAMQAAVREALKRHPTKSFGAAFDPERTDADNNSSIIQVDPSANALGATRAAPFPTGARTGTEAPTLDRPVLPAQTAERRTITIPPAHPIEAFLQRGVARQKSGDLPGAIADYTSALELDASCLDAYQNRGALRHRVGDYAAALTDYDSALKLRPENADLHFNCALALKALGDVVGAHRAAENAARLYGRSRETAKEAAEAWALASSVAPK